MAVKTNRLYQKSHSSYKSRSARYPRSIKHRSIRSNVGARYTSPRMSPNNRKGEKYFEAHKICRKIIVQREIVNPQIRQAILTQTLTQAKDRGLIKSSFPIKKVLEL